MVMLPSSLGPYTFGWPDGLWALLGILPLIILYLIRPRPKRLELPSLMFFIRTSGKSIVSSFFRTILRDFLFIIQLIACLALLLVPAQPYSSTQFDVAAEHTVLVIDTSASSQAMIGSGTRLEHALEQASNLLGKKTSIVLAKGTPEVLAHEVSPNEARKLLAAIEPTDTASRIGEAMILGGQVISGSGRVIVLSDFDNTDGVDPITARDVLGARGISVSFVRTNEGPLDNVGFVELNVGEEISTTYVRNFGKSPRSITLHIGSTSKTLELAAEELEPVQFKTPPGITELTLDTKDDFPADDKVTISAPPQESIRVHLITNNPSRFLQSALTSGKLIDLKVSQPPIVDKAEYDVYVLDALDKKEVLAGTYEDLLQRARNGAGVIIAAQSDSWAFDFGKLSPVTIDGEGTEGSITLDQETAITRNIDFGSAKKYPKATTVPGALSLASTGENNTLLALKEEGAGMVAYYGIIEDQSDFKLTPDYPILWQNLLRLLAHRQDIRDLNRRAGETLVIDDGSVILPNGKESAGPLVPLERRGVYRVGELDVAVNLLDSRESALRFESKIEAVGNARQVETAKEERQRQWEPILLIIGAIALLCELLFLKTRGDI